MREFGSQTRAVRGSWRSLLSLAVMLVFGLQSFLVQTHLHNLPQSLSAAAGISVSAPHSKAPLDTDKCLLCQEYLHGGAYLTPAAAAVLPPSAVVSLLPLRLAAVIAERPVSHSWMGRAPPRA
jgi:hypothetical protein